MHRDIATATSTVSAHVERLFAPYLGPDMLNAGAAWNREPGFTNLDCDPRADADVYHNLEITPLPFADESFDTILASHVLEHIVNILPLMADFYRILKPGGYLLALTPYAGSDDAWESPHHVRAFTERSWQYFTEVCYMGGDVHHAGYGAFQGGEFKPWRIVKTALSPYPEFVDDPELPWKKLHLRNVIQEVQAVLQKP